MEPGILDSKAIALLMVRTVLGILFFAQAYEKVVTMGMKSFIATLRDSEGTSRLPKGFVTFSAYLSSYIELIGGALLILGVLLPYAYPLLALNLVMVALGLSFLRPIWQLEHFFPRMAMLVLLMLLPAEWDLYRLSELF